MIPLRVETPGRVFPTLTVGLIGANVLFYVLAVGQFSPNLAVFIYGAIKKELTLSSQITSMFMHGGWFHLVGNMFFLWLFGKAVEDDLGPGPFLGFYILSGLFADGLHFAVAGGEGMAAYRPLVGASGAVAGLMGGYLVLFPKARAQILVTGWMARLAKAMEGEYSWFAISVVVWPAWVLIGFHIVMDLVSGLGSLGSNGGGVANWAHLGGYAGGAMLGLALKPLLRTGRELEHLVVPKKDPHTPPEEYPPPAGASAPAEEQWVNWPAVAKLFSDGAWPPKLAEMAQQENREALVPLLRRMLGHHLKQQNQAEVGRIRQVLRLLGVRLPGV